VVGTYNLILIINNIIILKQMHCLLLMHKLKYVKIHYLPIYYIKLFLLVNEKCFKLSIIKQNNVSIKKNYH